MTHMTDNHTLTTFFTVSDGSKAVEFYTEVLGAELLTRFDGPGGKIAHAELRLGDTVFQIGEAAPEAGIVAPPADGNNFTITFWTPDPDGVFERAVAAGATPVSPVADAFSGDRLGVVRDPAGVRWCLARHDRDVPPEEIAAAAEKWMAEQS
jgi:PhnB protein